MAKPWTGWNTSARSSAKADRAPVRKWTVRSKSCCTRGREASARETADTSPQANPRGPLTRCDATCSLN
jgi:hypothetical protein